MNMVGFDKVHSSMLQKGQVYYYRNKFGAGYVKAEESKMDGWLVELQPDANFSSPSLKRYSAGHIMLVPNDLGHFYEPQG